MSGNCHRGSAVPSSADCQLSQDSDEDDVSNGELWNHRQLQHQVGYLGLGGGFSGGLSPQPSSSVECERRVSPLDPNLSSAARYSPPPPYSSPIDEIEASIDHQNSPLDHLSHTNSLSSLPAGVSSSISSASESLVITEAHRLPPSVECSSVNRARDIPVANSLFSTPVTLVRTQPKWVAPRVTISGEFQNEVRAPAESIWAKQKRLASARNVNITASQHNASGLDQLSHHDSNSLQIISQPSPAGLQDTAVAGPSNLQALSRPGTSGLQRLSQSGHRSPKAIPQTSSSDIQITPMSGPSSIQTLSHFRVSSMQAISQPGPSGANIHGAQASSNNLQGSALPLHLLPKLKDIPQSPLCKSNDSTSSDEDDSPQFLRELSPTPGPSGVQNNLVNLNDSDAEALAGIVSGCEASSSSVQGRMSPLRSPSTPTDNCIVSSSTGHIDSIPPTPVEFQGNDVSGPNSPVSPSLACAAILDSTVDSTSGRGIIDPEVNATDDESDEELAASGQVPLPVIADEGGEISTSEVGLQNSDDSQDVALLVSPQGMFSSGRASANRFMEQLSLSLSNLPTNSLDASLSSVSAERFEPNIPPHSDSVSYLNDSLAIPGPSRVSLPVLSQVASSRQASSIPRDHGLDQPSTSSRQNITEPVAVLDNNLPLLDITGGLAGCSTAEDADQLVEEGEPENCEPLVSLASSVSSNVVSDNLAASSGSQSIGPLNHHQSYVLELNDESSMSSDALSTASLGKDDLSKRSLNHGSFANVTDETHPLLNPGQLVTESLNTSLDLNLSSSDVKVSVSLPGSLQQHSLAQHLLPSQPDQVSLLVGGGDESNDGALLMMVSSNGHSLPDALAMDKPAERGEASNHISQLSDSDSQILQPESVDQNLRDLTFDKNDEENQGKDKIDGNKDVEGYVEANFWCGDCEQMYNTECPQHQLQGISDRTVKTRACQSLPTQQLVIDKSSDIDGCIDCDQKSTPDCLHYRIQTISDKPVKTRAWASLPAQHLVIRKVQYTDEYGVFVRKTIPKRSRFGPMEGMLVESDRVANPVIDYTVRTDDKFMLLDTSDEDCSNWMRFVRKASTYLEQNCVVVQIEEALYFLTSADIPPRTELRVGYSKQYADKRNLSTLEPTEEEIQILDAMRKSWPCYECDEAFETSAELQQHLVCHDEEINEDDKKKKKRVKNRRTRTNGDPESKPAKKIKTEENEATQAGTSKGQEERVQVGWMDGFQRSQCLTCNLIFPMPELLKIHQLKHCIEASPAVVIKHEQNLKDQTGERTAGQENSSPSNAQSPEVAVEELPESASKTGDIADILMPFKKSCPQCKKVCDTDDALISHVDEHGAFHAGSSKPFKCDYCYKSFTRRFRLDAHKSVHGNEAEKPFRCNLCLRRFCSNSALTAHIRFHIEGCKGYDCPICREGFFSVAGLKAHVSTHCHNGEYSCPKCSKVFPSYSKIRRHIRSYHAVMPHVCSICGKEMPSVDKLKIHMLSHSDRRDFLCPDCGKRFKRKDKLGEHAKRMHSAEREDRSPKSVNKGPPKFVPKVDPADYKQFVYKCTTCMLGFKRRGMLVNHLAKRHPNVDMKCVPELNQPILKATRCYKCQHCDKRYRSSSKRKLHILKYHPGEELPPRSKAVSDNDNEGSSFTSSYPHPCSWCYRQYASRARLLRHQRHHHPSHCNNEGGSDSANNNNNNNNNGPFLDAPASISGEFSLNGQIVTDANILRNHRLVNLTRGAPSTAESEGAEEDLLTQAMGEITPLAARPVLVSGDGGQQGATLALVTADGPDAVTLSLPNGQFISLIPGLSVAGAPSAVTSTSRPSSNGGEGVGSADGVLQREEGPSMRMAAYTLGSTLNESNNEAEAVEQVVLATQQPPSPTNQVVWQHALAFSNTPT